MVHHKSTRDRWLICLSLSQLIKRSKGTFFPPDPDADVDGLRVQWWWPFPDTSDSGVLLLQFESHRSLMKRWRHLGLWFAPLLTLRLTWPRSVLADAGIPVHSKHCLLQNAWTMHGLTFHKCQSYTWQMLICYMFTCTDNNCYVNITITGHIYLLLWLSLHIGLHSIPWDYLLSTKTFAEYSIWPMVFDDPTSTIY